MITTRRWTPDRPHTLVVACSDGRLQEQTDDFLHKHLGLAQFDRFYVDVQRVILVFHGPSEGGPAEALCADYRRKLPYATPPYVAERQRMDALELIEIRSAWAGNAEVSAIRCEVDRSGEVSFIELHP